MDTEWTERVAWVCAAITACVVIVAIGQCSMKETEIKQAKQAATSKACIDAGAYWVADNCIPRPR